MSQYLQNQRLIFKDTIHKGLIGPGSDIFGMGDNEEIISDYPLKRYYSAVLFPEKETLKSRQTSIGLEADLNAQSEISDDKEEDGNEIAAFPETIENNPANPEGLKKTNRDLTEEFYSDANHYFPNNFGLTFCLDNNVASVTAEFSFAKYEQVKKGQGKIAISNKILVERNIADDCPHIKGFYYFWIGQKLDG